MLTYWPLDDVVVILGVYFPNALRVKFMSASREIALWWMSLNTFDEKSTLVQEMDWWHQAFTWANVDPDICRHMASPGQSLLIFKCLLPHNSHLFSIPEAPSTTIASSGGFKISGLTDTKPSSAPSSGPVFNFGKSTSSVFGGSTTTAFGSSSSTPFGGSSDSKPAGFGSGFSFAVSKPAEKQESGAGKMWFWCHSCHFFTQI